MAKAQSAKQAAETLQGKVDPLNPDTHDAGDGKEKQTTSTFALPAGFKVNKLITVPSLAIKEVGENHVLRFDSAMRVSKVTDKDKKREPATIADVTEVTTGRQFILLVPTVVKGNLERDFGLSPDAAEDELPAYVGKTFYIQNLGKRTPTQRYNDFGIAEVEPEAQAE